MEVKPDLLIAAASAGVLVYSGRLLVPAVRIRPEDIVAYKPMGGATVSYGIDPLSGGGMALFPYFPENDTILQIRDVLDAKVGFDLLVIGTIGGVVAVIVGAFTLTWNHPSSLDIAAAGAAGVLGFGAGWWWKERSGWYGRQERRLLAQCFLAWLEGAVADWRTKGRDASAVYVGRYLGQRTLTGWGDTVVNDIKAAQQLSIARRALVTMTFTGQSGSTPASYATTIGGVTVRNQALPSEIDLTSVTLQFNTLGAPTSSTPTTLTLSESRSSANIAITVVPVTGVVWRQ